MEGDFWVVPNCLPKGTFALLTRDYLTSNTFISNARLKFDNFQTYIGKYLLMVPVKIKWRLISLKLLLRYSSKYTGYLGQVLGKISLEKIFAPFSWSKKKWKPLYVFIVLYVSYANEHTQVTWPTFDLQNGFNIYFLLICIFWYIYEKLYPLVERK